MAVQELPGSCNPTGLLIVDNEGKGRTLNWYAVIMNALVMECDQLWRICVTKLIHADEVLICFHLNINL